MRLGVFARAIVFPAACLMALHAFGGSAADAAANSIEGKTRVAIVGLDHDHVWGLLKYLDAEAHAELVAIAEPQAALVKEAKGQVRGSVKFYSAYVPML